MGMLIAGVLLWSVMHLMKSVTPGVRASIQGALGEGPHKGMVALLILASMALMIFGWRSATPEYVYDAPLWGRHLTMTLMILAIYLIAVAQGKSRVRQWIRHPMLTGVLLWAIGHLVANGDSRSVVLFGGLGLWALISIFTVSRNEGAWVKPDEVAPLWREGLTIVIVAVLYGILFWAHPYIAGMPLVTR